MGLVDFVQLIMTLKLNLRCSYNLLSWLYRHVVGLNGLKDGQRLDSRWKQQKRGSRDTCRNRIKKDEEGEIGG